MSDRPALLKLRSADQQSYVILQPLEVDSCYPSVACRVEVTSGEFRGANPEVWLETAALQQFVDQLARLEQTRSGEALLTAMSPGDFSLCIKAADRLGHLLVGATAARVRFITTGAVCATDCATVNYELDASTLGAVLEDFRLLHGLLQGKA